MNKDAVKPNKEQQEVINAVDGPVLVVAGAGTGKTATVVKRIEHIINDGYARAWQVLAITAGTVVVFGIFITAICSIISVNKFLRMKAGDLYKI